MRHDGIRIVVADDQPAVRGAFTAVLQTHARMTVVDEAADGVEALELTRRLHPDILLTDIRMPRMDGLALAGELRDDPFTKVIVVTTFDLDEYVATALANGAHGFILKRSRPQLLIEAVLAAADGDALISPQLTLRLLQATRATQPMQAAPPAGADGMPGTAQHVPLTEREREIAAHVALGLTNGEIGRELYITAGTVKTHVANIQAKLGVSNRVGIAVRAWALGLVPE